MPFKTLTYDVFHLGLYMVAAVAWTTLCVMVLLSARGHAPNASNVSCLCTGVLGAIVCLGILLVDILRLVDERIVLFGLVIIGVVAPGLGSGALFMRLRMRRGNIY